MKKIFILFATIALLCSLAFAVAQDNSLSRNPENGGVPPEDQASQDNSQGLVTGTSQQNAGEDQQIRNEVQVQQTIQTQQQEVAQMQTRTQERQQQMQQELEQQMQGENEKVQEMLRNQNQVRLAVHALLDMEGLTGGIGKNVSAIAREFNNSIQSQFRAEEKIQTRSGFKKFFAGGDTDAAKELEQQVVQNQARLQEMTRLREQCTDCAEGVKAMVQQQIQVLQQEQTRLQQLAQENKESKGLLGWIWK